MNDDITPLQKCRIGTTTCGCRPENNEGTGSCGKILINPFSPIKNPASDFVGS